MSTSAFTQSIATCPKLTKKALQYLSRLFCLSRKAESLGKFSAAACDPGSARPKTRQYSWLRRGNNTRLITHPLSLMKAVACIPAFCAPSRNLLSIDIIAARDQCLAMTLKLDAGAQSNDEHFNYNSIFVGYQTRNIASSKSVSCFTLVISKYPKCLRYQMQAS